MKPILFLLLLSISINCKKESFPSLQEKISGKWELSRTWGTFVGGSENFPSGNGAVLQFSKNAFSQYSGAQLVQSGTFTITEDSVSFNIKGARLLFHASNGSHSEKFIKITDTSITLNDYTSDAEYKQYNRIQ